MSLKWPNKDPDETLDYSVDWSRFLNGATIVSVTWFIDASDGTKTELTAGGSVVNDMQLVGATNTSTVATANLGGGVNNTSYTFYCNIEASNALIVERSIRLRVRDK
mgnify:CR=1 FL=1|tara:strand:- start:7771 stop:8091 length:321 start_codon:yes stop_codon:yes gene_type:complete